MTEPERWIAQSFEEYQESITVSVDSSVGGGSRTISSVSCGNIDIWQHIEGYYTNEFRSVAKAKCEPDAKGQNLGRGRPLLVPKFRCHWVPK